MECAADLGAEQRSLAHAAVELKGVIQPLTHVLTSTEWAARLDLLLHTTYYTYYFTYPHYPLLTTHYCNLL